MDAHKNFARSTVATAPTPAASGLTLSVESGEGDRFPDVPFNATVKPAGQLATPDNSEIIRVTARADDDFTFTREEESSTAREIIIGDEIVAGVTAATITEIEDAIAALSTNIPVLTADPVSPSNDTAWVRRTGVSPAMNVALRIRIAGVTYTLASVTI